MAEPILTHDRLKSLFEYQPDTGKFVRRVNMGNKAAGTIAGTRHTSGYITLFFDNKRYYAHRLAWFYVHGSMPAMWIDHINGDKADNRIANLRHASPSTNNQNRRKCQRNSKTGILGVDIHKPSGRFRAQITISGKKHNIGNFDTAEEAHIAYLETKRKYHQGCMI
jgi:DUF971 family protein